MMALTAMGGVRMRCGFRLMLVKTCCGRDFTINGMLLDPGGCLWRPAMQERRCWTLWVAGRT